MIFKTAKSKLKHYNIPPTDENHELLRKAKAVIAASYPDQALELLSTLKLKTLDIQITSLNARLADLERTNRLGTLSYEAKNIERNRINEGLTNLISSLEKEIEESFAFYDKIKFALKSRYENRLNQKLSRRQPVNMRLVPSTTGTSPQAAATFLQYSEEEVRKKLAEYYEDAKGRILLIGVPGAGKTTLLLQLELELLEKGTSRIPVILNLARWSSAFSTLEAWIQEILPSEMGLTINKKVAADLIAKNQLILLLDGLDEVRVEDRQTCLEAIGVYGENPKRYFIISSRIDEYKIIAKDAPVNSQIEVGTLEYNQLIEQLGKGEQNEGNKRLLAALKEDKLLRKIAEVPFYFNTLQLLFARGKYLHEFNFAAQDIEGRKKEVEQNFAFEMLRKINFSGYDANLITKYLGFFASRLKRENLVGFELIDLQYSWANINKWEASIARFLDGLVYGLFEGLVLGLVVGLAFGLRVGLDGSLGGSLVKGLVVGLFLGLSFGLSFGLVKVLVGDLPDIYTKDNFKWNLKVFISWDILVFGLVFGLIKGLSEGLVKGLFEGLVKGLTVCLAIVLAVGIFKQLKNHNSFIQINDPYQRFRASAKALYFSILQHWRLSHILFKKGLLPKKLVPFLNDMVACNILETTGASWRFRHRILQDYFADQWVETEFEPEQK